MEHPYNKDEYRYILAEPDPHAPFRQVKVYRARTPSVCINRTLKLTHLLIIHFFFKPVIMIQVPSNTYINLIVVVFIFRCSNLKIGGSSVLVFHIIRQFAGNITKQEYPLHLKQVVAETKVHGIKTVYTYILRDI